MRRALLVLLILLLCGIGLVTIALPRLVAHWLEQPGPLPVETVVTIEPGSGLKRIADQLEALGAIDSALLFRAVARLSERDRGLRAGEYRLEPHAAPGEILDLFESGEVLLHALTVPEGLQTHEVLALVAASDFLEGTLPEEPPGEGRLLPETWLFPRGTERRTVVARMERAMDEALAAAWEGRNDDLPLASPVELLTLASIVQKETGLHAEYALVAGVFVNRLRRGMALQTDPTVIYAATDGRGRLGRPLRRSDLRLDHPYNTYVHPGLPPGPIANPGRAALQASADPAQTDYLYFVADGTGGHAFARTLAEHNRNVREWRRLRDGG